MTRRGSRVQLQISLTGPPRVCWVSAVTLVTPWNTLVQNPDPVDPPTLSPHPSTPDGLWEVGSLPEAPAPGCGYGDWLVHLRCVLTVLFPSRGPSTRTSWPGSGMRTS